MRYLIRYRRGPKDVARVALTFDDGPSLLTEKILDILKNHSIKATFFLIPENIEKSPEVARRIIAEGHEIGGHAHQPDVFSRWQSFWAQAPEVSITRSLEVTQKVLELHPRFFRPSPELALNMGTEKLLKKHELIPVLASAYSRVSRPLDIQIKEITERMRNGAIILLHDGHDLKTDSERPRDTIQILPAIIQTAQEKSLSFVKVSELLEIAPYR